MPRAGKDFTPQQKSAITRKYNKLRGVLDSEEKNTFIRFKKGMKYSGIEGLRTDKGVIVNVPNAKIETDKDTGKHVVVTKAKKFIIKDYYFPKSILISTIRIQKFVDYLRAKYGKKLYEIMWLRYGTRASNRYDPAIFTKYFTVEEGIDFTKDTDEKGPKLGSIIGVSLVVKKIEG